MLRGTKRDAQEVTAVVPPNVAPCTIEKVAINAVMAGCKPEYLPVVIAAVEGACTDEFNAHGVMATTLGASPVMVVNGPSRRKLDMNHGISVLGPGNRANAALGRAVRLVLRNVGGARPGGTQRSTLREPGPVHTLQPRSTCMGSHLPGVGGAQPVPAGGQRGHALRAHGRAPADR